MTPATRVTGLLETNAVAGPSSAAAVSAEVQVQVGEKRKRIESSDEQWTRPYPRDGSVGAQDQFGQSLLETSRSRLGALRTSSESFSKLITTIRELDHQSPVPDADLKLARSMACDLRYLAQYGLRADPGKLRCFSQSETNVQKSWTMYLRCKRYRSPQDLARAAQAVMREFPGDALQCTLLIEQCDKLAATKTPVWVMYAGQTEQSTAAGRCRADLAKPLPTFFSRWDKATAALGQDEWSVWSLKESIRRNATHHPVRENRAKQLAEYALVASISAASLNGAVGGLHHLPLLPTKPLSSLVPAQLRHDGVGKTLRPKLCPAVRDSFRSMLSTMHDLPEAVRSTLMGTVAQGIASAELANLVRLPGGRCPVVTVNHSATDEGYAAKERGFSWYGQKAGRAPRLNMRLRLSSLGLDPDDPRHHQENIRPLITGPAYDIYSVARQAPHWLMLAFLSRHLQALKPELISVRSALAANIFASDILRDLWSTHLTPDQQGTLDSFIRSQAVSAVDLETCLSARGRQAKDKALDGYSEQVGKLVVVAYGPGEDDWCLASFSFDAGWFKYDARLTVAAIRLQSLVSDRDVAIEEMLDRIVPQEDRKTWCLSWLDSIDRDLGDVQARIQNAKKDLSTLNDWYSHRIAGSTRQRELDGSKGKRRAFVQLDRSSLQVIGKPRSDERLAQWHSLLADDKERSQRGLEGRLPSLTPEGWDIERLSSWWIEAREGLNAIYSINATAHHPTANNDHAENVAYAARFGKKETGTRAVDSTHATTVPAGGPDGFSSTVETMLLVAELCNESSWLSRAQPIDGQSYAVFCRHCGAQAITSAKGEHGCFELRQEARRMSGLAGMPAKAQDVDAGFVSSSEALGLQKRRMVWAFQVCDHTVFGLNGRMKIEDLTGKNIELVNPVRYLPPQYAARVLPLMPVAVDASLSFRKANAIAVLLAHAETQIVQPAANVSDRPFWDLVSDRRMVVVATGRASARPAVCGHAQPCDHWSLQSKDTKHTCDSTVTPLAANLAFAAATTLETEPAAVSRSNRAGRAEGGVKKSKQKSRLTGQVTIASLARMPATGQLRLWTAFVRPQDPLHASVPSEIFAHIDDVARLKLGPPTL